MYGNRSRFIAGFRNAIFRTLSTISLLASYGVAFEPPQVDADEVHVHLADSDDVIGAELQFAQAMASAVSGSIGDALSELDLTEASDTTSIYAKAMLHLREDQLEEAARLLERICDAPDAPADTKKYLATVYLHLGEAKNANDVITEYLSIHDEDQYGIFLRGMTEARLDEPIKAKQTFQLAGFSEDQAQQIQLASMQVPVDAQQRMITVRQSTDSQFYRSPVSNRSQTSRPLSLTFLLGNDYDSNVPLRPFFSGLGSNFKHEDARAVTAAFADLRIVDRDIINVGLLAGTYNTFQYKLNEFNIDDFMGGAYSNVLLLDNWMSALRYEFHSTLVGDKQFSNDHRLTPSITRLGDLGHTTGYFEYNPIDNRAPALIAAQNQSADVYRVGITQAIYTFGGNGRIYGGYQFAEAFAQGTDFDRKSHMITGRVERPMSRNWIGDADVRYFFDNYENPNSLDFFERARDDDRFELRTGLQKNFKKPVSLRIDYTYINNTSNTENLFGVRFYDYDRHVVSTQLIFALR